MKLLLFYLRPYKWVVLLALVLAAINQSFSMLDPLFLGKIIDRFANHPHFLNANGNDYKNYIQGRARSASDFAWGVASYLGIIVGVAMVSRIAKAFQDYYQPGDRPEIRSHHLHGRPEALHDVAL